MSAAERSGWRDKEISSRHRDWGFNCPAVDLDFMLLEFNWGVPVAVVDYKHHSKPDPFQGLDKNSVKAMSGLYDKRGNQLPFYVTRYWKGETWAFEVLALNDAALSVAKSPDWIPMSEERWVRCLYWLRGRALDLNDSTISGPLSTQLPPSQECNLPIPAWLRSAQAALSTCDTGGARKVLAPSQHFTLGCLVCHETSRPPSTAKPSGSRVSTEA